MRFLFASVLYNCVVVLITPCSTLCLASIFTILHRILLTLCFVFVCMYVPMYVHLCICRYAHAHIYIMSIKYVLLKNQAILNIQVN